jgi:toxin YoeB
MVVRFSKNAWEYYLFWKKFNSKIVKNNDLIKAIKRTPFDGIGKPEP